MDCEKKAENFRQQHDCSFLGFLFCVITCKRS